jgi:pimeloyl-ACP methyl ester carboxylesterase
MRTITIGSIDLPTGVRLQYAEQGEPGGAPVLLLHGLSDSWRSYEQSLERLPDWVHAVAPTQRGHGDSERPDAGYGIEDLAADAAALIDALGLGPATVVGHSLGSWVAERLAIDHPERVAGLVLVGAFGPARENPVVVEFVEEAIAPMTDPIDPDFVREFQLSTITRPLPDGMLDTVVQESLKLPARAWKALCAGFLESDHTDELDAISARTLLIWGDRDAFATRSEQAWLESRIAGSRLLVYEGTGHAIQWEEPDRFTNDLVAFIGRPPAGAR